VFSQETVAETVATVAKELVSQKSNPWRWSQRWRHILFAHWQVLPELLLPHLPTGLELDTREGAAWISVVAFHLERVRLRGLPPLGFCSNFLELNLRTYVRLNGEPAIYFLSIHAGNRLAVGLARRLTPLPYAFAQMTYDRQHHDWRFESHRPRSKGGQLLFQAEFSPVVGRREVKADSLDAWLLERYVAYVAGEHGRLRRMSVQHPPWQVQDVVLRSAATELGQAWGLNLEHQPQRCHFAEKVEALLWPFEEVRPVIEHHD
jgi:uncharacterized protein YqjF (DUF2071 family)